MGYFARAFHFEQGYAFSFFLFPFWFRDCLTGGGSTTVSAGLCVYDKKWRTHHLNLAQNAIAYEDWCERCTLVVKGTFYFMIDLSDSFMHRFYCVDMRACI